MDNKTTDDASNITSEIIKTSIDGMNAAHQRGLDYALRRADLLKHDVFSSLKLIEENLTAITRNKQDDVVITLLVERTHELIEDIIKIIDIG